MNRLVNSMFWMMVYVVLIDVCVAQPGYSVDGDRIVHGPFVHENVGLFIVTGNELLKDSADYATLSEAMNHGWVVVHETGTVNRLAVENVTKDRTVVVLAGAVVKGGRQDRVLCVDLVLNPNSGKVPIDSFCVEQSRWQQRGNERLDRFASSSVQVSGKGLRKAVKGGYGQSRVWNDVAAEKSKLSRNLKTNISSTASPSSFQLAMENKRLHSESAKYMAALGNVVDQYPDAIGYAVTINGEFSTADVYASRGLFRRMWKQHLSSAVTEAISLQDEAKPGQELDLTWRDEIFKEQTYEPMLLKQTGGASEYAAEQNGKFFQYKSVLPGKGKLALRKSYEKRAVGESLAQQLDSMSQSPPVDQQGIFVPLSHTTPEQRRIHFSLALLAMLVGAYWLLLRTRSKPTLNESTGRQTAIDTSAPGTAHFDRSTLTQADSNAEHPPEPDRL